MDEQAAEDREKTLGWARRVIEAPLPEDADADALEAHQLVTDIGQLMLATVEGIDASQAPAEWWTNLAASTAFDDAFVEYEQDPTAEKLHELVDLRGAALVPLSPFALLRTAPDPEQLAQGATTFRRSAGQLIRGIEREVEEVRSEIEGLRTSLSAIESSRETSVSELQTKIGEVDDRLTSLRDSVVTVATTAESEFAAQQTNQQTAFQKFLEDQKADYEDALEEDRERAATQVNEANSAATAMLDGLRKLRDDATTIYQSVGAGIQADAYGKRADKEEKSADAWRWIAVGSLIAAAVLAFLLVVLNVPETDSTLRYLSGKLAVTILAVGVFAYAWRESANHRTLGAEYRRIQMDIASIDPYLALLPAEEANKISSSWPSGSSLLSAAPLPPFPSRGPIPIERIRPGHRLMRTSPPATQATPARGKAEPLSVRE